MIFREYYKIASGKTLPTFTVFAKKKERPIPLFDLKTNDCGNSGRYNHPNRATDSNYSDEFLKRYYNDKKEN